MNLNFQKNKFNNTFRPFPIFDSLERRDEEFDHDRSQCVKRMVRLKCLSDVENCVAHYLWSQFRQYRAKD